MKKAITIFILNLICISASATRQIHDKVMINGETWEIPVSPLLALDSGTYNLFIELLGERTFVSTAMQRGYVAYWHIGKRGLYLDKVEVPQNNGKMKDIDMSQLKTVMKKYRDKGMIRAEWLTSEVMIGKGVGPADPENPFAPSYAERRILEVKKGRIRNL